MESLLSIVVLAALVVALVALSRTGGGGDLARRLKRLEGEVRALRLALEAAGQGAAPSPPAVPPEEQGEGRRAPGVVAPSAATVVEPAAPPPGSGPREAAPSPPAARTAPGTSAAPSARPPASVPSGSPLGAVDWERWLGVRGAAVLGGAALALAGLFFFRYSIEHGLIPPWLRVVLGVVTGVAALAAAEWSLRKSYAGTANALAGGGLVVLYAAFWAAGTLYGLIPPGAVFVLMVAVTIAGCALSWRHESLVIAVIGLVGGFLTPLFASTGADRPIGLFGYVLLLDLGILFLARRRRWPSLGLLALAATALYEVLWIGGRMDAERTLLGLVILGLFALVFALAGPGAADDAPRGAWRSSRYGAVLVPLACATYFAGNADLDVGIVPLGGLLAVLVLAAGWLALAHGEGMLALGAAAAALGVVAVWVAEHPRLGGEPWSAAIALVILGVASHLPVELARPDARLRPVGSGGRGPDTEPGVPALAAAANAAALVGLGLLALLAAVAATSRVSLWPLLFGWVGLTAPLVRQGGLAGRGAVRVAAAIVVALGLAAYRVANQGRTSPVPSARPAVLLPVMLLVALAWQQIAIVAGRRRAASDVAAGGVVPGTPAVAQPAAAEHAAAAAALILLLGLVPEPLGGIWVGLGVPLVLGFLVLLAGTRLGGGPWLLAAVLATALAHFSWTMDLHPHASLGGLVLAFAASASFTLWPVFSAGRLRDDAWAWRASALAGLAWLPSLLVLFEDGLGDAAIGAVPVALGAVAVAAAARARELWPESSARRTSALAWLCGMALVFLTAAIPLQLEREWITIGWALEGAALIALWTRLDHPGLKYTGLALLAAATVRLVGNPEVLRYYPRPSWRIVNWLAYAYLVPAAALVYAAKLLSGLEVERLRDWERPYYRGSRPLGAGAAGVAALLVVFVWINLTIADWYSPGSGLALFASQAPAAKLTVSIAWALYAIALLALGVRLASGTLRWASLALLLVTIAKIFLYDVGELRDLYRVGALLGLALSLIVVSLVYQRFVFRRVVPEEG